MSAPGGLRQKQGYDPLEGVQTRVVTDSAGRQVEIPADIRRVAPSGSTAQMILMPIAYDLLAGLASSPSTAQMPYFPEEVRYLPTFGQFYGSKANLNMESLIDARPQIIIDLGDKKTASPTIWTASRSRPAFPRCSSRRTWTIWPPPIGCWGIS